METPLAHGNSGLKIFSHEREQDAAASGNGICA
jgi:hypothetical protein